MPSTEPSGVSTCLAASNPSATSMPMNSAKSVGILRPTAAYALARSASEHPLTSCVTTKGTPSSPTPMPRVSTTLG